MSWTIVKGDCKNYPMFDPTGIMQVVNSCIAIYKAIQSFIRYFTRMLEIAYSFIEGVAEIAKGVIDKAASYLEKTMANSLPVIIGFLANQVGLNLSERLKDALDIVREKVDKALGWIVEKLCAIVGKLVEMGKNAISKAMGGDPNAPSAVRVRNALNEAVPLVNKYAGKKVGALVYVHYFFQ